MTYIGEFLIIFAFAYMHNVILLGVTCAVVLLVMAYSMLAFLYILGHVMNQGQVGY